MTDIDDIPFWERRRGFGLVTAVYESRRSLRVLFDVRAIDEKISRLEDKIAYLRMYSTKVGMEAIHSMEDRIGELLSRKADLLSETKPGQQDLCDAWIGCAGLRYEGGDGNGNRWVSHPKEDE